MLFVYSGLSESKILYVLNNIFASVSVIPTSFAL